MSNAGGEQPSQPNDEHLPSVVIGIGASAGGIAALRTFFSNAQPDTGAAYVVKASRTVLRRRRHEGALRLRRGGSRWRGRWL